jgi:predicted ribosome quality control (RQC) complex YloA/Tae2 family protein
MAFREILIGKNKKIILGKDRNSNDELMKKFKGKSNKILHTAAPGSPFCVIEGKPTKKEINLSGAVCAKYSQDWRGNKSDVKMHVFTGKDISKPWFPKAGTWKVKKFKKITIKKRDILNYEKKKK